MKEKGVTLNRIRVHLNSPELTPDRSPAVAGGRLSFLLPFDSVHIFPQRL